MDYRATLCTSQPQKIRSHSHAMPCSLLFAFFTVPFITPVFVPMIGHEFGANGISVPIFRGGPPLAIE